MGEREARHDAFWGNEGFGIWKKLKVKMRFEEGRQDDEGKDETGYGMKE